MPHDSEYNRQQRERSIALNSETCIHWRPVAILRNMGPGYATCKAGVVYREAFGHEPGIHNRLPCRPPFKDKDERMLCPIGEFEALGVERATEEYDALMKLFDENEARILKAIEAIDGTGSGPRSGVLPCPNCEGELHFGVARNGHRMANCSTPDCVSFME